MSTFKPNEIIELIRTKDSDYWMKVREKTSLELFHKAADDVPAYKDFLNKNKIKHELIKSWNDFQLVPHTNKKNYLREYPLDKLCWDGTVNKPMVFTATSGSTGDPVYFVRQNKLDWQYSIILEQFLKNNFHNGDPVLVIVCFGMGLWIGGLLTYKAFELASIRNNLPLSVITPGINKKEIFNALRNIAPFYKNVIFAGYPPFIKDIIDEAEDNGVNLRKYETRLLFAAEAISEEFRDYVSQKLRIKDKYRGIISIYGSADIGAMANETLVSILIRRIARKNKEVFNNVFTKTNKNPTLAQYNPYFINFESVNEEILLTGDSAIPLVRYSIGDHGGVFSFNEVVDKLESFDIDLYKEARRLRIDNDLYKLPFVYVYERIDLSTTFYGLLIYPEWIRPAFLEKTVSEYVTGKFTMLTKYDEINNQYLEINIELQKGKKSTKRLEKLITQKIVQHLQSSSSEYREIYHHLKFRALPKLIFWPAENPLYFAPGVKQRWVIKEK